MRGRSSLPGLLLLAMGCHAAFEAAIPAASEVGLAGSQVVATWPGDAMEASPALAASLPGWVAGAGSTHPMGLPDLNLSGVWAGHSAVGWVPAWVVRWKGLEAQNLYREDLFSIDLATTGGWYQGGIGWRAGRVEVIEAVPHWIQGFAAGVVLRPDPRLAVGASWEDLSGFEGKDARWAQPWCLRLGIAVQPFDTTWGTMMGVTKRQRQPLAWTFGHQVRWKYLCLRGGIGLDPWVVSWGIGLRWEGLGIDWAQEGDPRLGWQQHWSLLVAR